MPQRKSSRLAFLGPRSKETKQTSPISIQEKSSDSESDLHTITSKETSREKRTKSKEEKGNKDQTMEKKQDEGEERQGSAAVSEPIMDTEAVEGEERQGSEAVSEPILETEAVPEAVVEGEKKGSKGKAETKKVTKKASKEKKKRTMKKEKTSEEVEKEISKKSKRKRETEESTTSMKKKKLYPNKVLECAFVDFNFFKENGFFWNHWLDRIGCRKICRTMDIVDGSLVSEFYNNLVQLEDLSLKSKVIGKSFTITREDLIKCFDLLDMKDNERLMTLGRAAVFRELNDGVGDFLEKDVFSTNFELIVRLLHKVVVDCILPKNGSTTTVSKEEAIVVLAMRKKIEIDMARIILRHMWRIRKNKPYGNLLMHLFKYKKIAMPKHFQNPIPLKKIGEINLKYMGIMVYDKFWFTMDGTWYRHPKFSKFSFDWKKIKAISEGEIILEEESGSEGDEKEDEGTKSFSRRVGKEEIKRKSKEKFKIRTGGKFEIREGKGTLAESDSETESESISIPTRPPGESSRSAITSELNEVLIQSFGEFKKTFMDSIVAVFNKHTQGIRIEEPSEPHFSHSLAPTSEVPDPALSSEAPAQPSEAPTKTPSEDQPEKDKAKDKEAEVKEKEAEGQEEEAGDGKTTAVPKENPTAEPLSETLQTETSQQEPPSQQPIQPTQPTQRTLPQRRKMRARKTVKPIPPKKN